MKRGDTWPYLKLVLSDQSGPINLSTATQVRLLLKSRTVVITTGPVTISNAVAGEITYQWEADDLLIAGDYDGEAEITWASGKVQTVPNDGYFTLHVVQDLGGSA
jgi:hypothetical protein